MFFVGIFIEGHGETLKKTDGNEVKVKMIKKIQPL